MGFAQDERLFAMAADDERVFFIPASQLEAVLEGIEVTHKRRGVENPDTLLWTSHEARVSETL